MAMKCGFFWRNKVALWKEEELKHIFGVASVPSLFIPVSGVSIDSRALKPGDLFVCLRGDNSDGHLYVRAAFEKGAAAALVESNRLEECRALAPTLPLFASEDPLLSLQAFASEARKRFRGKVIGVTGSNGKTSAKEMLVTAGGALLSPGEVCATEGNLNNHIGLPLSLIRSDENAKLVILEMGMNHSGEIALLSRIARPDVSLIVSIGSAHIEFFDSIRGIAAAKLEILEGMKEKSALVFPAKAQGLDLARSACEKKKIELHLFDPEQAGDSSVSFDGISFRWKNHVIRNGHYFNPVMISNMLGVLETLLLCGFSIPDLLRAAPEIRPLARRRFQVFRKPRPEKSPALLVDDTYNANPDSFRESMKALRAILPNGKIALIAGEMAELGERGPDEHAGIGSLAAELDFILVGLSGKENARRIETAFCASAPQDRARVILETGPEKLADTLLAPGVLDEMDGILVKGSRSARMDIVSDRIREKGYV